MSKIKSHPSISTYSIFLFILMFITCSCIFAGDVLPGDLRKSLLADYDFSKNTGTVLENTISKENNAEIFNGKWEKTGDAYKINFSGDNSYIALPLDIFNQKSGSLEILFLADVENMSDNKFRLINSQHSKKGKYEFRTYLLKNSPVWIVGNGKVEYDVKIGSLKNEQWNHLVITWQYNNATDKTLVKTYNNGAFIHKINIKGTIPMPDKGLYLFKWNKYYMPGSIKCLRIYKKALSIEEIAKLENDGM